MTRRDAHLDPPALDIAIRPLDQTAGVMPSDSVALGVRVFSLARQAGRPATRESAGFRE
jgi:hypothetical protein